MFDYLLGKINTFYLLVTSETSTSAGNFGAVCKTALVKPAIPLFYLVGINGGLLYIN